MFKSSKNKSVIPPVQDDRQSYAPRPGQSSANGYGSSRGPQAPVGASQYAPSERAPSYRTNTSSTYGDPPRSNGYGAPAATGYGAPAGPSRTAGGYGAPAGRGYGQPADRDELFKGAKPPSDRYAQRSLDNIPGEQQQVTQEEEDDEVEAIKQQMRFTKQESLGSTRNALRTAREAEETARSTLTRLGEQSDRLANTDRHLDIAKGYNDRAKDEAEEIRRLNRSIFRPTWSFNKEKKRDAEDARQLARHMREKEEREETRLQAMQSQQRIEGAFRKAGKTSSSLDRNGPHATAQRLQQRSRYQFESTASDDELEDELDSNLNEIGDVAARLKVMAMAAGQEVDSQNRKLDGLSTKTDTLDMRISSNTEYLKRIK
ncbi:uncharacterized protein L969DRAFT_20166 [Mixia osmundae IAM 14324]|uniref:t-SNARE coiled-coil homology domain-containing protein n=1 Tax=Mixia osmundae (strain CBS 9802 / IAM 14324 / JCM 22182 / KY 12970) TaxID=764103 RepID=G7DW69_MIXOS|nr:uncharacterized protein L969DRAFT_20166 [Mixia osmundae IAM 14324]KEI36426.1 hypothetical protein L969DRAFT_20166 [Mixia osmundae IAM 14324]GAA94875.1 hypothetical protein E5Q_01530 [Mixia osmundae IAM 14324]